MIDQRNFRLSLLYEFIQQTFSEELAENLLLKTDYFNELAYMLDNSFS